MFRELTSFYRIDLHLENRPVPVRMSINNHGKIERDDLKGLQHRCDQFQIRRDSSIVVQ